MSSDKKTISQLTPLSSLSGTEPFVVGPSNSATPLVIAAYTSLTFGISATVGTTGCDYTTDGTADDVQIQAAIDAMNSAGGGLVFLKDRNYYTTTEITLRSNVTIYGLGKGVTVIHSSVGTSSWCFDTNTTGQGKTDRENIFVKDLTIESVTNSHSAIIRNTTNAGFIRVEAYHTNWSGSARETLVLQHCANAYQYNNFVHDSTGNGIQINACDYFIVSGNRVINFYNNLAMAGTHHLDDGIDIDEDFLDSQTIPSRYGVVKDNFVDGSTNGNNYRIASSQHVYVINNISLNHNCGAAASILVNSYSSASHPSTNNIYIYDNNVFTGSDIGIKVEDAGSTINNIYVKRNNIKDVGVSAAGGQLGAGILLNATGVVTTDNLLDNCGKTGADGGALMIYKKSTQTIRRNRVINSAGYGVSFWNGDAAQTYTGIELEDTEVLNNATNYLIGTVVTFTAAKRNQGLNQDKTYAQGNITGATTFNRANGSTITATLTGNITVTLTNGVIAGDTLTLILTQDGTGSRTVTWPANFKKAGGTLTLSTGAGAVDTISMTWDGSFWREVSRSLNVS